MSLCGQDGKLKHANRRDVDVYIYIYVYNVKYIDLCLYYVVYTIVCTARCVTSCPYSSLLAIGQLCVIAAFRRETLWTAHAIDLQIPGSVMVRN